MLPTWKRNISIFIAVRSAKKILVGPHKMWWAFVQRLKCLFFFSLGFMMYGWLYRHLMPNIFFLFLFISCTTSHRGSWFGSISDIAVQYVSLTGYAKVWPFSWLEFYIRWIKISTFNAIRKRQHKFNIKLISLNQ